MTSSLPTLEDLESGEISVCKDCNSQMVEDGYCENCHEATDFKNLKVYFAKDIDKLILAHTAAHDKEMGKRKVGEFVGEESFFYYKGARDAVLAIAGAKTIEELEGK